MNRGRGKGGEKFLGVLFHGMISGLLCAQTGQHQTWQTEHVAWCGTNATWVHATSSEGASRFHLHAEGPGTQILWGCPTPSAWDSSATSWEAEVLWEQGVYGSNANRSSVFWAVPPASDPSESAWLLATSHEAGWLDETGGVAAGQTGAEDPLICHAPNSSPWSVPPTCHLWSDPFLFQSNWTWGPEGKWKVVARDEGLRGQQWVDTTVSVDVDQAPCIGIAVTHTSSHGDQWSFGWSPLPSAEVENEPSSQAEIELVDSTQLQAVIWPMPQHTPALMTTMGAPHGSAVSLQATTASCDNLWNWTLPSPVSAGHSIRFSLDGSRCTLWRDGSELLQEGDLAFCEIMADPTPAVHAPESTYLEVLNTSSLAVNPQSLVLWDSGNLHALKWVIPPPQDVVKPLDRFLIVNSTEPWLASELEEVAVLQALGWTGLRDEGEAIELWSPTGPIESLRYFDDWWEDQDGIALSCRSPSGCDHPDNWRPDPHGASPGRPAAFEDTFAPLVPNRLELRRNPFEGISIHPTPPWDQRHAPAMQLSWASGDTLLPVHWSWDETGQMLWEADWPSTAPSRIHVSMDGAKSCLKPKQGVHVDTLWFAYRPARPGDIGLSEILPASHPVIHSEFVEWTNIASDTLHWLGRCWPPGKALVEANLSAMEFELWLGGAWAISQSSGLWVVREELALSNAAGEVALVNEWGQGVAQGQYSKCNHSEAQSTNETKSLERLPWVSLVAEEVVHPGRDLWRTCPDPKGMSPGIPSSWALPDPSDPASPSWGVLEGRWVVTIPPGTSSHIWKPENWLPRTHWEEKWLQGVPLALAHWGPDSLAIGPVHLENPNFSFPELPWGAESSNRARPEWNEILFEPREGHTKFIEWVVPDLDVWTTNWHWASGEWLNASDFKAVSEVSWWIPTEQETCFADCPNHVEQRTEGACLPANLPSINRNRTLSVLTPMGEFRTNLAFFELSPWVVNAEGLSQARIPNTQQWSTTPPHLGSTPGEPNGPSSLSSNSGSTLTCSPNTIQPGGAVGWDAVQMEWRGENEEDHFSFEFGVIDPIQGQTLQWQEASWIGQNLSWTWKGDDQRGVVQPPGNYVAVVAWRNLTLGTRGADRCLIALSPH